MRRLAAAVVFVAVATSGVVASTSPPPTVHAAGPQQVLAFANVVGGMFQRQRVYRNAAEVQDEIRAYYDGLIDTARAALRDRDLAHTGSQLGTYVRMVASLEVEKEAALQLLEDDKRGARNTFRNTLNQQLPSLLLAIPAVRETAQVLHGNLGELRDVLTATRAAVAEGRPSALLDLATHRARLDQFAALMATIGGQPGRDLANAVGALGQRLQQLEAAGDQVADEIDGGLAEAQQQVELAWDRLGLQLEQEVRPASTSLFGGLGEVRIPGRYAYYAAIADALSGPGGRAHGLTRDAMRDRVRQFLIDTKGSELGALADCFRASAAQLRAHLSGVAAEDGAAAALLLTAELKTCDPAIVRAVLAAAAQLDMTAPTTPTTPTPTTAGDGNDTTATSVASTGPVGDDRVRGGEIHVVTPATPDLILGNSRGQCLEYRKQQTDAPLLLLTACTTAPDFEVVYDLDAGTLAGRIDLELACPGAEACWEGYAITGSVSGTFGPFEFGRKPPTPPPGFPFPEHHYYDDTSDWWAGGPIELQVAIAGSHQLGEQVYTGSDSTTIMGWAEAGLGPSRVKDGVPSDWNVDFSVHLDYPQDVDPNWYLYTGFFAPIDETGIELPPWRR
ncbi:MAG: hypothetical protein QNJ12_04525 [Ilumatobacter sp.]|uniref:hypothetical protein n=1 Tax=Ilumatobacter sp. TaxID=1967498 RepID=UPI002611AE75|nr:hypothetical protein [Ilumatobacter sp.]MDJ0768031.1 hypothetical protein [Ilumatobacter sp.]